MIQVAESRNEGSTRGIYETENLKGRVFLATSKDQALHALLWKELGIVLEESAVPEEVDPLSKLRRVGSHKPKKLADMTPDELEQAFRDGARQATSVEYEELQRTISTKKVMGLSDLGLDLDRFTYKRK